ncbi:restriction endonuclease subunit S [Kaistella carnis]|uniref:restriction endonuclease subunit S n=1 Tax=Kaistella carnis TaxID=1241979 RepID=UPI0028A0A941|nr:restriction endonuclease subunit S [Kaistella carnis]
MKLGNVIELGKSKTILIENEVEYRIAGVSSYGLGVRNRRFDLGQNLKMKKYQIIEEDYLMWCKVDTKNGAFGITKSEHSDSLASTNMCLAKVNKDKIYPDFLEFLFRFKPFYENITKLSSGTTNRKYLTPIQLCETITIPNLTLEQQKEFLLKQENLEDINLQNELTHQLSLISQLRQAFLKEAMQGKLVSNDTADGKTGADLLAEIQTEKEKLIKEKKIKKQKPLPPISEAEIPFDIPQNWVWCRLGEIINDIKYGTSKSSDYNSEKNSKILRIPNVSSGIIDATDLKYTDLTQKEFTDLKLNYGDLLTIRSNGSKHLVGRIAFIERQFEGFCYAGYLVRLRFNNIIINTRFINSFSKSDYFRFQVEDPLRTTVGINNINTTELSNLIVPLPPHEIQNRIVSKLEELMTYCNDLETSVKESQNYNEQLLQQVLREALEVKEVAGEVK